MAHILGFLANEGSFVRIHVMRILVCWDPYFWAHYVQSPHVANKDPLHY